MKIPTLSTSLLDREQQQQSSEQSSSGPPSSSSLLSSSSHQSISGTSAFRGYQLFRYSPSKSLRNFFLYNAPNESLGASVVISDTCIVIVKERRSDWRLVCVGNVSGWMNVPNAAFSQSFKRKHEVYRYETLPPEMSRIGWFGGRLMLGPDFIYFVITNVLTAAVGLYFLVLSWKRLTEYRFLVTVLFSILLLATLISLWLIYFTDPGIIPANPPLCNSDKDYNPLKFYEYPTTFHMPILEEGSEKSRRLCTYCNIFRPTRYKHCHRCNSCVIGHDHHCPLTGTCIGQRNYFYFVFFLFAINSLLIFSSVVSIYLICSQPGSAAKRVKNEPGLTFIAIWSSSFFILFQLFYLLLFHIYLIIEGKTTYEYYKGKNHFDENDEEKILRHFTSIPSLLFESKFGESHKSLSDALTPDEYYRYYDMDAPQPHFTPTSSPFSSANSSPFSSANSSRRQSDDISNSDLEQGDNDNNNSSNNNDNKNNHYNSSSNSNSNSASISAYLDGASVHSDVDVAAVKSPIFQLTPVPSPSNSPRALSNNEV